MSTNSSELMRDYAVPPGSILEERLEIRGWSQAEFARRCGRSPKHISEIISGQAPIEPETALQFENVLDLPATVWLNLESNYRLHLARAREHEALGSLRDWYAQFPIQELVKEGILQRPTIEGQGIKTLLSFFGVGNVRAWETKFGQHVALARHSNAFKSSAESVSVWLRLGELGALDQKCAAYDAARFKDALKEIRLLSRFGPAEFHPRMTHICNRAGVAFVLVPPISGIKLCGAAWWRNRKTPVIQQSLRGKLNDIFWFTFFHEAAHILLHSKKDTFVDEERTDGSACEEEANSWAADFLVPPEDWAQFVRERKFSESSISKFAATQGIAPAIVLGRLQHETLVGWRTPLNRIFKEHYELV